MTCHVGHEVETHRASHHDDIVWHTLAPSVLGSGVPPDGFDPRTKALVDRSHYEKLISRVDALPKRIAMGGSVSLEQVSHFERVLPHCE